MLMTPWRQTTVPRPRVWMGAALVVWTTVCLASGPVPTSAQTAQIWPLPYENQWHWVDAQSNLGPQEVQAILKEAVADAARFEDPQWANAIFIVRRLKPATKSKVAGLEVNGDWQATNSGKHGSKTVFVPLDPMTAATLWYQPGNRRWKWNVKIYPAPLYDFYFTTDELARRFINALASARKQHAAPSKWLKFGMMTQDLSPEQAVDAGRPRVDSVFVGMVAFGGPADRAGIQANDVIVEFDGAAVLNAYQFDGLINSTAPGTSVTLTLLRRSKVPEGTKPQGPEGVRDQYIWERKTVDVTAR